MNTPFDILVGAFKIVASDGSSETITKECAKQIIKNQNFAPYHENNLITIIETANCPDQMVLGLMEYMQVISF